MVMRTVNDDDDYVLVTHPTMSDKCFVMCFRS